MPHFSNMQIAGIVCAAAALFLGARQTWKHMRDVLADEAIVNVDSQEELQRAIEHKYGVADEDQAGPAGAAPFTYDRIQAQTQAEFRNLRGQVAEFSGEAGAQVAGQQPGATAVPVERDPGRDDTSGQASTSGAARWWQQGTVYLITNILDGGEEHGNPIMLATADQRPIIPVFRTRTAAMAFKAACIRWGNTGSDTYMRAFVADQSPGLRVDSIEPDSLNLLDVPLMALVPEGLLADEALGNSAQWRAALLDVVADQIRDWDTYAASLRHQQLSRAAPRQAEPPVPSGPKIYGSARDMPAGEGRDGAVDEEPRLLTDAEADHSLIHTRWFALPVLFVPMVSRHHLVDEAEGAMMVTVDVSIDPERRDVVALACEDVVDAHALLGVLHHQPGFTDEEGVVKRVVPLQARHADEGARAQDAEVLCLASGFRSKAQLRVGGELGPVLSKIAGARWASQIEQQLQQARS